VTGVKRAILLLAALPAALAVAYLASLDFSGSGESAASREHLAKDGLREQRAKDGSWQQLAKDVSWQQLAQHREYYMGLFSPEAKSEILSSRPTPVPSFTAGSAESQIERIKKGKLFVDSRGPVQDLAKVEWSATEYGQYYATQLHGLAGVGAVLEARKQLPEGVVKAIAHHINDWAFNSLRNPDVNPRAWYEGTVTKRLANLLHLLNYQRLFGPIEGLELEQLLYLIHLHATLLLDHVVYSSGNHGLRQDMVLAATAIALPNHPRADEMLNLAEKRLDRMAHDLFTESGIWLEHAPGYIQYVVGLLQEVKELATYAANFNPKLLLQHHDSSLSFLLASLTPDQRIPYIGRSGASHLKESIYVQLAKNGTNMDTILKEHERSLTADREYGHAIVRGDHPNGLYLLFVAAQNLPAGKRHADDLSFILFHGGRPWITEGGHQSYELTGMTKYLRSPLAHNTYTLNGEFLGARERRELDTELTEATQDDGIIILKGYSERFPEPAHLERQIEVTDFSSLRIRDRLKASGKDPQWEGRFQFPGDLSVTVEGQTVHVADTKTGQEMLLSFRAGQPLSFSTCTGQEKPICGWGKTGEAFGPSTTLMWHTQGNTEIDISIEWRGPGVASAEQNAK
jgi:hypothetical protein